MKCVETIPLERQQQIHKAFWQMETRDERLQWIFAMIEQNEVHSHRAIKSRTATKNRNITRVYRFLVDGVYKVVCKKFFLSTLGYKHDAILTNLFKAMTPSKIRPLNDRRGKHTPKHALSDETLELIDRHIESFHPETSHYRREHAPLRRYLPPELNITLMHKLFDEDNPKMCFRRTYARRVQAKNVSFCKLGEEECEVCEAIEHHKCSATPSASFSLQDNETEELATELADYAIEEKVLHKESLPGDNWNLKKSVKERIESIVLGKCNLCDDWVEHIKLAY